MLKDKLTPLCDRHYETMAPLQFGKPSAWVLAFRCLQCTRHYEADEGYFDMDGDQKLLEKITVIRCPLHGRAAYICAYDRKTKKETMACPESGCTWTDTAVG